jgi:glycosyltransferase EpsF
MSKIKVLHIITCFGMGGAETWLLELSRLIKKNSDYTGRIQFDYLLVGGSPADLLTNDILSTGSQIHYLNFNLGSFFTFREKFIKLLKCERYTALHSHLDFISGWIFIAGLWSLPKIRVSHLHNPYLNICKYLEASPHRYISYYIGRVLTYLLSSIITGTSNQVLNEYGYNKWPYKNKNIGASYCGFDPKRFLLNPQLIKTIISSEFPMIKTSSKIALFVGRIDLDDQEGINQKNPEFAFEIAKELVRRDRNWHFVFLGKKGVLAESLGKAAKELGLEDNISFLGVRHDVANFMTASNLLVFPAFSEGLGMVAVEAQASGIPVLVSEAVPLEAKVVNELFHVKSLEDLANSWVDKILEIDDHSSYSRDVANERVNQSPFSITKSLEKLIKIYN